jgi:hypothetical protein
VFNSCYCVCPYFGNALTIGLFTLHTSTTHYAVNYLFSTKYPKV